MYGCCFFYLKCKYIIFVIYNQIQYKKDEQQNKKTMFKTLVFTATTISMTITLPTKTFKNRMLFLTQ